MAKSSNLIFGTGLAAAVGGLDGVAASRDQNKGRNWNSPGLAAGLAPVVGWGWAPLVQIAALAVGGVGAMAGRSWGTPTMCAGAATLSRAAAFRIMQGQQSSPVPAQGMTARGRFVTAGLGGTDQAYIGGRTNPAPGDSSGNGMVYDRTALGPVTARGWSGVPGQYGDPGIVQKQQASGLL